MNVHHILCPYDFSSSSDVALKLAGSLARESAARLTVLHVEESPLAYGAGFGGFVPPRPESSVAVQDLRGALPTVEGVTAVQKVVSGTPAEEIVRFADQNSVDLIVLGTHGRTGLARILMGSVAEAVVRRASCPVLACKSETESAVDTDEPDRTEML